MLECTGAHSIGEGPAMEKPRVRIYSAYKSSYAFVAHKRLFELEEKFGVELEWLTCTLRATEFMGTAEERTPHFWRKIRCGRARKPAPEVTPQGSCFQSVYHPWLSCRMVETPGPEACSEKASRSPMMRRPT